jgi:hypothetical protein
MIWYFAWLRRWLLHQAETIHYCAKTDDELLTIAIYHASRCKTLLQQARETMPESEQRLVQRTLDELAHARLRLMGLRGLHRDRRRCR